jgi:hypothetical protein
VWTDADQIAVLDNLGDGLNARPDLFVDRSDWSKLVRI